MKNNIKLIWMVIAIIIACSSVTSLTDPFRRITATGPKSVSFDFDNSENQISHSSEITASFNKQCGEVGGYTLVEWGLCHHYVPDFQVSKVTGCRSISIYSAKDSKNISTEDCQEVDSRIESGVKDLQYYDYCEKPISYDPVNRNYKAIFDFKLAECSPNEYGYKIDWLPQAAGIEKSDWLWFNSTWLSRFQLNYTCQNLNNCLNELIVYNYSALSDCDLDLIVVYRNSTVIPFEINDSTKLLFTMFNGTYNTPNYDYALYCNNPAPPALADPDFNLFYEACDSINAWTFTNAANENLTHNISGGVTSGRSGGYGNFCDLYVYQAAGEDQSITKSLERTVNMTNLYWVMFWKPAYGGTTGAGGNFGLSSVTGSGYPQQAIFHQSPGQAATYDTSAHAMWTDANKWFVVKSNARLALTNNYIVFENNTNGFGPYNFRTGYTGNMSYMLLSGKWHGLPALDASFDEIFVSAYNISLYHEKGKLAALAKETETTLAFNSQSPNDIDSLNAINRKINITYNFSGYNPTTARLFYKVNSTNSDYSINVNGSWGAYGGFASVNCSNLTASVFCYLDDNQVYPGNYEYNETFIEGNSHLALALNNQNKMVKVEYYNLYGNETQSFLEGMFNTTSGVMQILYCNSNYLNDSPNPNPNCRPIATDTAADQYNHTHSGGLSSHKIKIIGINTTDSTINGLAVTPNYGYFIFYNSGSSNYYYLNGVKSRVNTVQYSANGGVTWVDQNMVLDLHTHQQSNITRLSYLLCMNSTASNAEECTAVRTDIYQLGGMPPSQADVSTPSNGTDYTQGDLISIGYNPCISPNGYNITRYNISLYSQGLAYVQDIKANNSVNLSFDWDSSSPYANSGVYRIGVDCFDQNSLHTLSLGFEFNILTGCNSTFICNGESVCSGGFKNCTSALDTTCGAAYAGNYSEFGQSPCSATVAGSIDFASTSGVLLFGVLAFLWVTVLIAGIALKEWPLKMFASIMSFVIGVLVLSFSPWIAIFIIAIGLSQMFIF